MYSDEPYKPTSAGAQSATPNLAYGVIAVIEAAVATVFFLLAAGMACLTIAFLFWAIREGNVPLFGMFMAASIRAGVAFVFCVLGLLFLMAARTASGAAAGNEPISANKMQRVHWLLLLGMVTVTLLCCGAVAAFFIAIGLSNM